QKTTNTSSASTTTAQKTTNTSSASTTTAKQTTGTSGASTTTAKQTTGTSRASTTTAKQTTGTSRASTTTAKQTTGTSRVSTTTAKQTTGTGNGTTTTGTSATTSISSVTTNQASVTTTQVSSYPMRGIDVSVYQGNVDWMAVKNSGIDFAIIRAGYGKYLNQEDKYFDINMKNAQAAGIDCGAYWFSYATTPEDAIQEADVCYEIIKDYQFEYPICFDYETSAQYGLSPEQSTAVINAFCKRMESYGYYVSLYSFVSFLNTRIETSVMNEYDLWIAHHGVSVPSFTRNHGMWQYSSSGIVPGVSTPVDMNYAYYSYPQIMIDHKLNGF
ncbi:MAG: glycoside hydrolase family 25 protein, partial [Ruminococcus sp.]